MDDENESKGQSEEIQSVGGSVGRFLEKVKEAVSLINDELEGQILDLQGQVTTLKDQNGRLILAYENMKSRLQEAKKDCFDPDSPEAMSENFDLWTSKTLTRADGKILGEEELILNHSLQEYLGLEKSTITLLEFVTIVRNLPIAGG